MAKIAFFGCQKFQIVNNITEVPIYRVECFFKLPHQFLKIIATVIPVLTEALVEKL